MTHLTQLPLPLEFVEHGPRVAIEVPMSERQLYDAIAQDVISYVEHHTVGRGWDKKIGIPRNGKAFLGYKVIGNGAFRTVLDLGDRVLKVDRGCKWEFPISQVGQKNLDEVMRWQDADDTSALCPILVYGSNWNVMPKVQDIGRVSLKDRRKIGTSLGLRDIHKWNFGYLNGKPVMLDYTQ